MSKAEAKELRRASWSGDVDAVRALLGVEEALCCVPPGRRLSGATRPGAFVWAARCDLEARITLSGGLLQQPLEGRIGQDTEKARRGKQTRVVLDTSACQSETVFDGWRNQTQ
jgi:hypothetical protein